MSVTNRSDAKDCNVIIMHGFRIHSEVRTLAAALVLGETAAPIQYIDCGGAGRNLDLPDSINGTIFIIHNESDAAEAITVRNSAAATIGIVSGSASGTTNEVGWFQRVNGAWRVMQIFVQVADAA